MLGTSGQIMDTVIALLKQDKEEALSDLKELRGPARSLTLAQEAFEKLSGTSGMLDLEDAAGFYSQAGDAPFNIA